MAKKEPKEVTKKVRKYSTNLKVQLTDNEIIEAASAMAKSMDIVKSLEADLASLKSNFKAKIAEETARLEQYQGKVRNKSDYREVDCEETKDKKTKKITTVRLDTGEVIEDRNMTYNELQGKLFEDDN